MRRRYTEVIDRTAPVESRPESVTGAMLLARVLRLARRTILVLLLVATPLTVAPSVTLDPYNMPKLALLMAGVPIAATIKLVEVALGASAFRGRGLLTPAAAMSVPLAAAWIASSQRAWALWGEGTRLQGLVPYLVVIAFGILLLDSFRGDPLTIAWCIAASGGMVGAVAAYQMIAAGSRIDQFSDSGYVTATLGHSNFAGGFLAITLPVAVALWVRGGRGKWVGLVLVAVIADGLAFTFSQGGWAAAVGGVAVTVGMIVAVKHPISAKLGVGIAVAVAAVSVGAVVATAVVPGLLERLPGLASTYTRSFLWMQASDLFLERPVLGWGPNAFALEAPSHRLEEEAIVGGSFFGDDAHSVPMSMLANAGVFGAAGYLFVALWAVRRWRPAFSSDRVLAAAFAGGLTAYGIQSLVSFDEISLRVALWACLAGWAGLAIRSATRLRLQDRGARPRLAMIGAACVLLVALSIWSAINLLLADAAARTAVVKLQADDVDGATGAFDAAISRRDAFEYRRAYAEALGEKAIDLELAGRSLLDQMSRQYELLARKGDPHATRDHARYLHGWSLFDNSVDAKALELYRRALRDDPNNPVLATHAADVMISLGRLEEAANLLERFVPLLIEKYPEYKLMKQNQPYWGGLAMVRALQGDDAAAAQAIEMSETIPGDDCRTWIARELLKPEQKRARPAGIGFLCPRVLLRILPA